MIQRLLVGGVCLLKILHHEVAVSQAAPDVAIGAIQLDNGLEVFHGARKVFLGAQDARNGRHGGDRELIVSQRLFVGVDGAVEVSHHFGQRA